MSKTMKYLHVGPGGRNCSCCFESPSSKGRKLEFRKAKKREKREAIKESMEDLSGDY